MYPNHLFGLIPPFPRTKRVFVAMSFDARFDDRWENVLVPAIGSLSSGGETLEAFRVDLSRASDAILTEILTAISESHCIVADISALNELDGRPVRNANVMYEVGLAHAARLPEEVILFRSDDHRLDFDISGVRVHKYDPDGNPDVAKAFAAETIVESLKALDAKRRTSVRVAAERLTLPAVYLLLTVMQAGEVQHPETRTMGQALGSLERAEAISLLLELGALRAQVLRITPELLRQKGTDPSTPLLSYVLSPFGRALIEALADTMGAFDPKMREHIETIIKNTDGAA